MNAFTRVELLFVLVCITLMGLVALPLLGRTRSAGSQAMCMNNLRNLDRVMLIYSDQNRGLVPEEGNIGALITDPSNADAWYNLAVLPEYPTMTNLYRASSYPLPGNGTVYSCPNATAPALPSKGFCFFMYGENNFICVNKSSRQVGFPQTRINLLPRPQQTIFMGEVAYNGTIVPALSGVTANYTAVRHDGFGEFAMTDGSVRLFTTNESVHVSSSAAQEWYVNGTGGQLASRPCYWWPTPSTPQ